MAKKGKVGRPPLKNHQEGERKRARGISISDDLYTRIQAAAEAEDESFSGFIINVMEAYLRYPKEMNLYMLKAKQQRMLEEAKALGKEINSNAAWQVRQELGKEEVEENKWKKPFIAKG